MKQRLRHGLGVLCFSFVLLAILCGFSPVSQRLRWISPLAEDELRFSPVSNKFSWISSLAEDKPSVCVEKKRVAFVKVHKAASTTVTTILQRYGVNHHLMFALPKEGLGFYHIGLFETLHSKNLAPIPNGTTYEILCQHVVYNEEAFAKYLPPDITVIAAVREPLHRFVSAFQFFPEYRRSVIKLSKLDRKASDTELMREFLRLPEYYEPTGLKRGSLAMNRMSFDLGIPKTQFNNYSFVENYIKMLDRNMELVLISEQFDASLVILKRRLCWSTKDILYITQHKGGRRKPKIPEDIAKRVEQLTASDYQIYDYFSKKFKTIAAREIDFKAEVDLFQRIKRNISDFCNKKQRSKDLLTIDKNPFSEGFNFTKTDCHWLSTGEVSYVKLLRSMQASAVQQQVMKFAKRA